MSFIPCPSCRRHVRGGESACPFCAAALPEDHASRAIPKSSTRLGRGALFAFAVSVSACGASTEGEPVTTDTGPVKSDAALDTGGTAPLYGAPADTGGPAPAYGAPADTGPFDTKGDTGIDDDGAPAAAYGLPPG